MKTELPELDLSGSALPGHGIPWDRLSLKPLFRLAKVRFVKDPGLAGPLAPLLRASTAARFASENPLQTAPPVALTNSNEMS